jgi:hypothetical protein
MRTTTTQVEVVGQYRDVTVGDVTFRTNLSRSGFWIGDRQVEGTAQRSFASDAAFRRYAQRVYRERYANATLEG